MEGVTRLKLASLLTAGFLVAAPVGFFAGKSIVGSAASQSADGDPPAESSDPFADFWSRDDLETDPQFANHIPGDQPAWLSKECAGVWQRRADPSIDPSEVEACEVILLVQQDKMEPGYYSNPEIDRIRERQDPDTPAPESRP